MELSPSVSLVIPGRNCAATIAACLGSVVPLLADPSIPLQEIIFVDDASTDHTAAIVAHFPVTYLKGEGKGAGAARNLGWQCAMHPFVWFIDADCVASPDALPLLLKQFDNNKVAGVGGSYGNMHTDSLLACLIHEEIIERHRSMARRVDFLATFNVVYRKEVLIKLRGFDERFLKAQDAEFAWRVVDAGFELGFEIDSRVKHFHATAWRPYLRTQLDQGYWRVWLHLTHRGRARSNSYSNLTDHLQPPLALLCLASLPLLPATGTYWPPLVLLGCLMAAQWPMTRRLLRRTRNPAFFCFPIMASVRALWRGAGMTLGILSVLKQRGIGLLG